MSFFQFVRLTSQNSPCPNKIYLFLFCRYLLITSGKNLYIRECFFGISNLSSFIFHEIELFVRCIGISFVSRTPIHDSYTHTPDRRNSNNVQDETSSTLSQKERTSKPVPWVVCMCAFHSKGEQKAAAATARGSESRDSDRPTDRRARSCGVQCAMPFRYKNETRRVPRVRD